MGILKKIKAVFAEPMNTAPIFQAADGRLSKEGANTLKYDLHVDSKKTRSIRIREFNKLRTVRKRLDESNNLTHSVSSTASSSTQKEERISTLKKIDEIEEQMSMQWWKTERFDSPK